MVLWFVCVHMSGEADACLLSICSVLAVLVTQEGVGKVISAFMSFTISEGAAQESPWFLVGWGSGWGWGIRGRLPRGEDT